MTSKLDKNPETTHVLDVHAYSRGLIRIAAFYWREYPSRSALVVLALLISGLFEGFGMASILPLLSLLMVSNAEPQQGIFTFVTDAFDFAGLPFTVEWALVVIVVTLGLKTSLSVLSNIYMKYSKEHITRDFRTKLIDAVATARWRYFTDQDSGTIANIVSVEADRATDTFNCMQKLYQAAIQTLLYATLGIALSLETLALGVVIGLTSLLILKPLMAMARSSGADQITHLRNLVSRLMQGLNTLKPLKAMGVQNRVLTLLVDHNTALNRANRRAALSSFALRGAQELLILVALATTIYVGLRLLQIPMAELAFMVIVLTRLHTHISSLQRSYQSAVNREAVFHRMLASLDQIGAERETWKGTLARPEQCSIVFDHVSYMHEDDPTLQDLSLVISANEVTLIVGPSGSGKTTIIDLICGFHTPEKGRIVVGGIDLRDVDIQTWRESIGYVPQEPVLINDTIFNNIALADPAISEDDVERALRLAGAWELVNALPARLHSMVGERGNRLSGGERQRICLARALVHQPRLLILDEATAAVDPATEREIFERLRYLKENMTIVVISHQQSVFEFADHVTELRNGRLQSTSAGQGEAVSPVSGAIG